MIDPLRQTLCGKGFDEILEDEYKNLQKAFNDGYKKGRKQALKEISVKDKANNMDE